MKSFDWFHGSCSRVFFFSIILTFRAFPCSFHFRTFHPVSISLRSSHLPASSVTPGRKESREREHRSQSSHSAGDYSCSSCFLITFVSVRILAGGSLTLDMIGESECAPQSVRSLHWKLLLVTSLLPLFHLYLSGSFREAPVHEKGSWGNNMVTPPTQPAAMTSWLLFRLEVCQPIFDLPSTSPQHSTWKIEWSTVNMQGASHLMKELLNKNVFQYSIPLFMDKFT